MMLSSAEFTLLRLGAKRSNEISLNAIAVKYHLIKKNLNMH